MKCSLIYRRWWFFYFTMLVYFFRHPKWRGWSQVEKKCCFLGTAGATIFIWSVMMIGHQLVNCEFLCVECMQMYIWLVVWNMNFIFHNIWDNPSQLTFIIFRGVGIPPTRYILYCLYTCIYILIYRYIHAYRNVRWRLLVCAKVYVHRYDIDACTANWRNLYVWLGMGGCKPFYEVRSRR